MDLNQHIRALYREFGPSKSMASNRLDTETPNYFLHRDFLGEQDLLIIFKTKRCRYHCAFCELPVINSPSFISSDNIEAQFLFVSDQLKHSLGVIQRFTVSNDGSVLDTTTFPKDALLSILSSSQELPAVRRIVLETRAEFVTDEYLREIRSVRRNGSINLLLGFETYDQYIRDTILTKHEPLDTFLEALEIISHNAAEVTAYVLFKPSPEMNDSEAVVEAERTIDFLISACTKKHIPLSIRLNPMYAAKNSRWAARAGSIASYSPPRLTDVLAVAAKAKTSGIPVHIGLSTEGLATNSYRDRDDFSPQLLKIAIKSNHANSA